jgi:hypothetical protein
VLQRLREFDVALPVIVVTGVAKPFDLDNLARVLAAGPMRAGPIV